MDRRRNPALRENWALRCRECRVIFSGPGMEHDIRIHFNQMHDGRDVDADHKWVGQGDPPLYKPRKN